MQITSQKGSVVLDYYPIKNWENVIDPDNVLRILTFRGETMTKRIVSKEIRDDEVIDRVDNYTYEITGNKDNVPQYSSLSVETALNKLSPLEV